MIRRLTRLRVPSCALDLIRLAADLTSLRQALSATASFTNAWPQEVRSVQVALNQCIEDCDDAVGMGGGMLDAAPGFAGVVAAGNDVAMAASLTQLVGVANEVSILDDMENLLIRMAFNIANATQTYSDAPYPTATGTPVYRAG